MSNITPAAQRPSAFRMQPGETPWEHLQFLYWACGEGDLVPELADRFDWAQRRTVIASFEGFEGLEPDEQMVEAAMMRVRIVLSEVAKLQTHVISSPDNVLTPTEIFAGVEWMMEKREAYAERRSNMLDWSSLTPEEREIMIQAKEIQDRLIRE